MTGWRFGIQFTHIVCIFWSRASFSGFVVGAAPMGATDKMSYSGLYCTSEGQRYKTENRLISANAKFGPGAG